MTTAAEIARFEELINKWMTHDNYKLIREPHRYLEIWQDVYSVRNAGWDGNPPLSFWPTELIDKIAGRINDDMMAAVEHYFLARSWVGTGRVSALELRVMSFTYYALKELARAVGLESYLRHNPNNPTTPPSGLQVMAKERGLQDGIADLAKHRRTSGEVLPPLRYDRR